MSIEITHHSIQLRRGVTVAALGVLMFGGVALMLADSLSVFAVSPPNVIPYQGRLLNANGVPDASASRDFQFRLFDSLAAGTCLWSNDDSSCVSDADLAVTLTDGLFSENLGDTGAGYAAIPDSVFADDASVFLEVEVEGEVLSPRKQIGAAAYAFNADTLDGTALSVPADKDMTLTGGVNGFSFDGTTFSVDAANDRIGIGDASPAATLTVGASDAFQVNASGYVTLPAGSLASPSLNFSRETDTGLSEATIAGSGVPGPAPFISINCVKDGLIGIAATPVHTRY